MKVAIVTDDGEKDISELLTKCTWSGDLNQAARQLEFSFVQSTNTPAINVKSGAVVYGADDEGNLVFIGKVYQIENDRKASTVSITAYDNLYILNKSKTTRKYTDALPEDIAVEICKEMNIAVGEIAKTGERVSFIANNRTGYQIIQGAYTEAHKKNEKIYQCVMNGNKLSVIEQGELCGVILDSSANMNESIYRESIENIVNRVLVVDDSGNAIGSAVEDSESQAEYGITIQSVYKEHKDKDSTEEAKDLIKGAKREGTVVAIGDYRAKTGYSLQINDANFAGKFYVKSDSHTFRNNSHEMRLKLEFENIMNEVTVEKPK